MADENKGDNRARYWNAVLYVENMRTDWQDSISKILQLPYAYCIHDKDVESNGSPRKVHVHLIIAFNNTTTYQNALSIVSELSAEGKKAVNKVERCKNIRWSYDYLIHDSEECRKKKKYQYDESQRVTGNNFDIGAYEQVSIADKQEILNALRHDVKSQGFCNLIDFFDFVDSKYADDTRYNEVATERYGFFSKLCEGNYHKLMFRKDFGTGVDMVYNEENFQKTPKKSQSIPTKSQSIPTKNTLICCKNCGSINVVKCGKTSKNRQIWKCKDCGKRFAE